MGGERNQGEKCKFLDSCHHSGDSEQEEPAENVREAQCLVEFGSVRMYPYMCLHRNMSEKKV